MTRASPSARSDRRRRRAIAVAAAALAHAAVLAALLGTFRADVRPVEAEPVIVTLVEGLIPGAARTPAPTPVSEAAVTLEPVLETVQSEPPPELVLVDPTLPPLDLTRDPDAVGDADPVQAALALAQAEGGGATCNLGESLRAALADDASVQGGLAALPRRSRSVANAVMLWDGDWIAPDAAAARLLTPVRSAILDGVREAPGACLDETLQGPLFIPVGVGAETVMLTVGSGVWRWADVLDDR